MAGANLTFVGLAQADLFGAVLVDAALARANFGRANLTHAHLGRAFLTGADLTGVRWPEGARVPDGWMIDSGSSQLKRPGELSEVTDHYPW